MSSAPCRGINFLATGFVKWWHYLKFPSRRLIRSYRTWRSFEVGVVAPSKEHAHGAQWPDGDAYIMRLLRGSSY